jgi:rubrerythrin
VWDTGFESTTQHAEEQYEAALEKIQEINDLLSNPPVSYDLLRKLIKYTSGMFRCKECGKSLLKWIHFGDDENEAKLRKMLTTACPKCNNTDNFIFE